MAKRVLITGARAPSALDLARSFHAAGFETHMADCAPSLMAAWSHSVAKAHRFPSPRVNFAKFAVAAKALIDELAPVLVIPTCEEVFYVAALGEDRVLAPPPAVLRRLHSKFQFAEDVTALGLSAPRTTRVQSAEELMALADDPSDLVFKPEFSRFGTQTLVGPTKSELDLVAPSAQAPWVVQQRVRGAEVSFYAASVNARLVAFSAYRSPWKFDGGAGYAFEVLPAPLHDRLLEIATVLAEKLIPRGQFACDVIVEADETLWLLECNPRATSGVHLFDRRAALAAALLGEAEAPVLAADAAPKHVGPALWAFGLGDALKQSRLKEWRERRAVSADVISAPRDRAPVAGALLDTMRLGIGGLARGKSLTEMSTADIEWNGEPL
jgi:hypothetical protein